MNHSPYSPDLAPSDYYLLQNLKKCHGVINLDQIHRLKLAIFESSLNPILGRNKKLEMHLIKSIELKGDNVEKRKYFY